MNELTFGQEALSQEAWEFINKLTTVSQEELKYLIEEASLLLNKVVEADNTYNIPD